MGTSDPVQVAREPAHSRLARPPLPWLLRLPGLILAIVLLLAYRGSEGNIRALFSIDARRALADFLGGFWPPEHSFAFLTIIARPLVETVAIAFLGITLALILALPLSVLAVSPGALVASADRATGLRRAAYFGSRFLLNLMRSIPELIWALIFVRAVGIGPAAGVLAIGIGYAGVIGKVFAEIFESVPRGPVEGLATSGAPPSRAFAFGLLPSALPLMGSYLLYRFDCALRASAVLGIVGAGGLGLQLELSMKMFNYHEVASLVLVMFLLVTAADQASRKIRLRLHRSSGLLPVRRNQLWSRASILASWAVAIGAAGWFLGLPLGELFSAEAARQMTSFVASMFPPDLSAPFLASIGPAVVETLAVSVLGTAIAAVLGICLAYPAAHRLHSEVDEGEPGSWRRRPLTFAAAWLARSVLNLGRTLPELVWAMLFIFVVGLGPFAGALALGIHTAGVLGRLYSEALEEAPAGPLAALRGSGASHLAAAAFAVLPQSFPQLVAYTLYRWEVNIRAAAVLGVVGAGGLGKALHLSLGLFMNHRTLTLIIVLVLMVTAVDLISGWLRTRVQQAGTRRIGPDVSDAIQIEAAASA